MRVLLASVSTTTIYNSCVQDGYTLSMCEQDACVPCVFEQDTRIPSHDAFVPFYERTCIVKDSTHNDNVLLSNSYALSAPVQINASCSGMHTCLDFSWPD